MPQYFDDLTSDELKALLGASRRRADSMAEQWQREKSKINEIERILMDRSMMAKVKA
jgi:predicted transcriptional regulator